MMGALCCPTFLSAQSASFINPAGTTIETRFTLPEGYKRVPVQKNSYAYFLRRLPMLPYDAVSNNSPPESQHVGALNLYPMNNMLKEIQLCVRLRGEYFFRREQYDKIGFSIVNFQRVFYREFVEGLMMTIGDKSYSTKQRLGVERYSSFNGYLGFVFINSDINTTLLDVQSVFINDIMPGDMFIQSGSSGGAVIVLDVAYNPSTGDRIFLLAKNHKPARVAYVLVNPKERWSGSPWYKVKTEGDKIVTPEFVFYKHDLRRFQDMMVTTAQK
jgi:hypothetical protein